MIKKPINQNHSFDLELLNSIGYNYIFNNEPINRSKNKINNTEKSEEDKITKLINLKKEINSIKENILIIGASSGIGNDLLKLFLNNKKIKIIGTYYKNKIRENRKNLIIWFYEKNIDG